MKKYREKLLEKEREEILRLAKEELLRGGRGKKALNYLINNRKLKASIIDKFNVGYCPPDVDHQLNGRIITPVYDSNNCLIALSTRHLDSDNPHRFWHESFDKGSYLYGLNWAKYEIQQKNKAILVEGEFDVMCLHSYGFKMAVGMLGTSFTLFQIALLSRYCSEIYLIFDGDEAGRRSMERSMKFYEKEGIKSYGLTFIPVYLPSGDDPDDFLLREGVHNMKQKLSKSREEILSF